MTTTHSEHQARRAAKRIGLIARKSRWRKNTIDNFGEFQLIDLHKNMVVKGPRYELSADDVVEFCNATAAQFDESMREQCRAMGLSEDEIARTKVEILRWRRVHDDNDEASNFKTPDRKIQIQPMRGVISTGQLAKLVEDGKISKRVLLEIRDGKYSDGEPAGPSVLDGFYFVELDDNDRILDDWLYGPYSDAIEAEIAAREGFTTRRIVGHIDFFDDRNPDPDAAERALRRAGYTVVRPSARDQCAAVLGDDFAEVYIDVSLSQREAVLAEAGALSVVDEYWEEIDKIVDKYGGICNGIFVESPD